MTGPKRKEYIVNDKPGPCPSCPDHDTCTELCEKVELWASQDYVGKNSSMLLQNGSDVKGYYDDFLDIVKHTKEPYPEKDSDVSQLAWNVIVEMRLSTKVTRFIYSYYMLGKRIRDIAIDEGATSQAIDQRHLQAKRSIKNRIESEEWWLSVRDGLKYNSVRDYDICRLFYTGRYPRKIIAKIIGIHVSTVIKLINKKNRELKQG